MHAHGRWRTTLAALVSTASLLLAGSAVLTAPAQGAAPAPAAPSIDWQRCAYIHALCASVPVPLDYDDPGGPTFKLSVIKVPALDPTQKIGTIFVNPGGPGGSAVEFAAYGADLLGDTVAMRYDVIGIDPRGVGGKPRMSCKKDGYPHYPRNDFPWRWNQVDKAWAYSSWFRNACEENPNAIVAHMTTADTARDMDYVRELIGEPLLNYYGISYGTYLGATYARMFPDKVGKFVVDGVLDPVQWSKGDGTNGNLPFSTRIDSASGATDSLKSGLRECDRLGRKACPFAATKSQGTALKKWRKLVRLAQAEKLRLYDSKLRYPTLVGYTLGSLYESTYDSLGYLLQDMWNENVAKGRHQRLLPGMTVAKMRAAAREVRRNPWAPTSAAGYGQFGDPFLGVACSDTTNPKGKKAWWRAGQAQDKESAWFGSLWTWASAPCSGWPKETKADRFTGFTPVATATPMLVVGNAHDPATPIHGARTVHDLFTNSGMLKLNGWGHGAITNTCVTAAYDAYYVDGTLPASGTVCQPDAPLFGSMDGGGFRSVRGPWPGVTRHR